MAQTKLGAIKSSAKHRGITVEEYMDRISKGEKWCTKGKHWTNRERFNKDASRSDGVCASCQICLRVAVRKNMKGKPNPMKGRRFSDEARANMGRKKGSLNPHKRGPRSIAERAKTSASLRASPNVARGSRCHSYKDGKVKERRGERHSLENKRWRFDVYSRDRFTCQDCGDERGGNLHAHHLKAWADFPDLRFDVSNGVTLCEPCHKNRHRSIPAH